MVAASTTRPDQPLDRASCIIPHPAPVHPPCLVAHNLALAALSSVPATRDLTQQSHTHMPSICNYSCPHQIRSPGRQLLAPEAVSPPTNKAQQALRPTHEPHAALAAPGPACPKPSQHAASDRRLYGRLSNPAHFPCAAELPCSVQSSPGLSRHRRPVACGEGTGIGTAGGCVCKIEFRHRVTES
ncbi:hypothetical protein BCR34DRAFT_589950 [Clohesyomyces aquaticus]|uniref:Uncharacterized protein n=1 Tax=Clohesyomyces aquaticus TaxID=1231657 RepID=A0A1Y1ZDX8_9PLEO|nr:hypothetical protein BCR34DRAFT_589950 [Clohesyomyces aquaticus]